MEECFSTLTFLQFFYKHLKSPCIKCSHDSEFIWLYSPEEFRPTMILHDIVLTKNFLNVRDASIISCIIRALHDRLR